MKHKLNQLITLIASAGAIATPVAFAGGNHLDGHQRDASDMDQMSCTCMDRRAHQGQGAEDLMRSQFHFKMHDENQMGFRSDRDYRNSNYTSDMKSDRSWTPDSKSNKDQYTESKTMPTTSSSADFTTGYYGENYVETTINRVPTQGQGSRDLTVSEPMMNARREMNPSYENGREINESAGSQRRMQRNWHDSNNDSKTTRE